jgi:hypothetical protein
MLQASLYRTMNATGITLSDYECYRHHYIGLKVCYSNNFIGQSVPQEPSAAVKEEFHLTTGTTVKVLSYSNASDPFSGSRCATEPDLLHPAFNGICIKHDATIISSYQVYYRKIVSK